MSPVAPNSYPLSSKTAIVTGGSRGIGRAISLHLASLGASVLIVHSDPSKAARAQETVKEILTANAPTKGLAASVCADLRSYTTSPTTIVQAALRELKTDKIDILINNAALNDFTPTAAITDKVYDDIMGANFKGPLFLTAEVVKHMGHGGGGGRIVNVSTVLAKNVMPEQVAPLYSASKAAMDSLTRTWAFEYGKSKGVTVNSVSVGPTMTDMAHAFGKEALERFVGIVTPYTAAGDRLAEPEDIAQVVGFLASEGSRWVTGSTIGASGGRFFD